MTRQQTDLGVQAALNNLSKKSIRKACEAAGISVTTLYNKTTPEQRDAASKGRIEAAIKSTPKKRGRPAANPSAPNTEIPKRNDPKYVAKLEKALLARILEE